jgi:hypothetical protein
MTIGIAREEFPLHESHDITIASYRAALLCVTGQDIEMEGATLARLARFYVKVVKLAVPYVTDGNLPPCFTLTVLCSAHQLYLRAVHLAASLAPALPKGDWYKDCVTAVQAHRDELQARETKEWMARREPILLKLAADIAKLRGGKHMSDRKLCEVSSELFLSVGSL